MLEMEHLEITQGMWIFFPLTILYGKSNLSNKIFGMLLHREGVLVLLWTLWKKFRDTIIIKKIKACPSKFNIYFGQKNQKKKPLKIPTSLQMVLA